MGTQTLIEPAHWPLLHDAVSRLARVCDYATERDGAGFSATDAAVGHFLAELPLPEWAAEHATAARGLLPTYRRQLGDTLTTAIKAIPHPGAEDMDTAREQVRVQHRAERERQYRRRASYVRIDSDRVSLAFPYDAELVDQAKTIAGRRYDGSTRTNTYPLSSLPAVIGFAVNAGIDIDPEVLAVGRDVALNPAAYTPLEVTLAPQDPAVLQIQTDYDPVLNEALRSLNGGSTWRSSRRLHEIDIAVGAARLLEVLDAKNLKIAEDARQALREAIDTQRGQSGGTAHLNEAGVLEILPTTPAATKAVTARLRGLAGSSVHRTQLLAWPVHVEPGDVAELLDEQGFDVAPAARDALAAEVRRQQANLTASRAHDAAPVDIPELGVALMPHQAGGVQWALAGRRVVIGDDMGLGKTITSLAAVAADDAFPAIVACKPDLTENWRREINRALPGRTVAIATGMRASSLPADVDVVIIGYSILGAKRGVGGKGARSPWVRELSTLQPRALIIDEGHLGKEVTAARSRALAALGADVAARDGLILNLTGTLLVNRPRELAQQLITLGLLAAKDTPVDPVRHLFGGEWDFLFRYCGPTESPGYGWTFDGASHTFELNHRLRVWGVMLRRTEDALDLPPFTLQKLALQPQDLGSERLGDYRAAEERTATDLAREASDLAAYFGVDVGDERVRSAMRGRAAGHLTRLNELRQLIGVAKLSAITAWVQQQVVAGEKVMIAGHHRDVVDHYAAAFGGLKIQGGQSVDAKEADKAAFQTQPISQAPAITVSIGAGGVGHTLTAARIGVQAELCWTPGDLRQMAKRIHRIGQDRPVTYHVAVVPGTIDEQMWSLITSKQAVLDAVIDGIDTTDTSEEVTAAAAVAWELTQAGLRKLAQDAA